MVNKGLTCSQCGQHGHMSRDCPKDGSQPREVILNPTISFSPPQSQPLVIDFPSPHSDTTFAIDSIKAGFVGPGGTAIFRRGSYHFQTGAFARDAIGPGGTLIFESGKYTFMSDFLGSDALGAGSTLYFSSYDTYFCRGAFGSHDFCRGNCNIIFHDMSRSTSLRAFRDGVAPAAVSVFFPGRDSDFPVDRFPALKPRLDKNRASSQTLQKRKAESPDLFRIKASLRDAAEESRVGRLERYTDAAPPSAPSAPTARRGATTTAKESTSSSGIHPSRLALLPKSTNHSQSQTVTAAAGKPGPENNHVGFGSSTTKDQQPFSGLADPTFVWDSLSISAASPSKPLLPKAYVAAAAKANTSQSSPPRAKSPLRDPVPASTVRGSIGEQGTGYFGQVASNVPTDEDIDMLFMKGEMSSKD
ncbi:MAG: hypothetical protein M1812_006598 [Candelaria pacifica]|nr:MAG: hypothetical protein M1812_006598 [Candelaria pacifica]